jgi:hypothetical protein
VISKEEEFRVSLKKLEKVLAALAQLLSSSTVSPRQLAAVAGKLISLAPAVLPASLYSRKFFQAIQRKISWDQIFPTTDSVRKEAQEWIDNLPNWNGRKWHAQPISVAASSEASDFGFGGQILLPEGQRIPFRGISQSRKSSLQARPESRSPSSSCWRRHVSCTRARSGILLFSLQ